MDAGECYGQLCNVYRADRPFTDVSNYQFRLHEDPKAVAAVLRVRAAAMTE